MANIEHIVGVRLLDRTTRGVELTTYGQALVRRGMGAFDELRQGISDIELLADPTAGEIRVGSPEAITCGLLSAVLARFSCQYPRVIVNVFSANDLPKQFTLLRERDVDLLIGGIPDQLVAEDLKAEILYEDRPLIVSGGKNRFASRGKIELEDLVDEPWLLTPASIFISVLAQAFLSKGLAFPQGGVRSFSTYQRLSLFAPDRFIGRVPNSLLQLNYDQFPLKALPVDFAARSFRVAILTLKDRMPNPIVRTFIDCVHEVARADEARGIGGE